MPLIADIFLVNLVDENNDVIATSTLQEGNLEVTVSENDVRGGRGNALLAVLHSDRDIAINLTDAEFRYDWLAKQLGQDIVTGAGTAYAMPKWYTAADIDTATAGDQPGITLDKTPSDSTSLAIYNESGVKITGFTVSGATVDFAVASPAVAVGDLVDVRTYIYATSAQAETITIDNTVFAKGVKAILETLEIDSEENPTHKLQYQFDKAIPSGNFSINTSSERTANTQAFNLRVVKPATSNVVGRVVREPIV
jgi:hypothetical protein